MRRTVLAGLMILLLVPHGALADWEVKRGGNGALVDQAARKLAEQPDDHALANRLVRLAGKDRLGALLEEFRRRAEAGSATYAAVEAYARLLLLSGKPADAAESFERAAALRPDAAAPLAGRAAALRASGQREGAIAAYQRALKLETKPAERRRLLEALVTQLTEPTDFEVEIASRRELLALDPKDDVAAEHLADALERAGRPGEAAHLLEQRLRGGGNEPWELALRVVELRVAAGADETAAQLIASLLKKLPMSAGERRRDLWMRAIDVARRLTQLDQLARQLERAPGIVEWEVLSQVRDELGDLDGALEAARRAIARAPRNLEVRRRIVALLERLGLEDEVTAEYKALSRLQPHESRFAIELLERQFRRGKKPDAQRHFDRAMARFARSRAALGQLAELASRWSEDQRAVAAWERLHRLSPHDELAILGLGEAHFQRGKKETALRTWQGLRKGAASKAEGHGRLAEVLMEHDLLTEATAEAQLAQSLEPKQPRHHRTLAQILERQRKPEAAIKEWEIVLGMSGGSSHAGERHEARSRILALLSREGRGRLDERVRRMEEQLRGQPQDREAALFLAEAQLRSGNLAAAIATLRGVIERDGKVAEPDPISHAGGDAILALVRLLRQTRQLDEAVRWLEELARRTPSRAREAHIQMADIELGRYDDRRALAHAEQAARLAPGDGQALVRIAEVEERAGETTRALATYRRAFARDGNPTAAFALARLLERHGSPREAAGMLRGVLRNASEEEVINDAARRAMDLEEYLGTLGDLERMIGGLSFSAQKGTAYRQVFVAVLRRLLPALYRAAPDTRAAAAEHARLAQHGLRPLLELLTAGERDPDRALIELLGMLGNPDAAPVLTRLAQLPISTAAEPSAGAAPRRLTVSPVTEAQLAAVIALGRLRDERGRVVLESLVAASDGGLRAAAVWAVGRIGNPQSSDLLLKAIDDPRPDVAALACLGLGRLRDPRWTSTLTAIAAQPARQPRLRRAAVTALGLSRDRGATTTLLTLLDSGDEDLARSAAAALGTIADPAAVVPLLTHVLVQRRSRPAADGPSLAALDRFVAGPAVDDEATSIEGNRLDVDLMLETMVAAAPARPELRVPLWVDRARDIQDILAEALSRPRDFKLHALALLDSRDDGPGLGRLAPQGSAEITPSVAQALREIASTIRDRLAALLDDPDPEVQGLTLRLLAKLSDPRVTPARIVSVAAVAGQHPGSLVVPAASFAAAWQVRARPESAGAIAQALAPLTADPSWERRLAAVEVLRTLGAAGRRLLEGALLDDSPLVRAAATAALAAKTIDARTIDPNPHGEP